MILRLRIMTFLLYKYVEYHKEEIRPYAEVLAEFKAAYEEVKRFEEEFRKLINL